MARLAELERKLAVTVASCGDLAPPTDDCDHLRERLRGLGRRPGERGLADLRPRRHGALLCAVQRLATAAAFMCDTSRIAMVHGTETFALSCNL